MESAMFSGCCLAAVLALAALASPHLLAAAASASAAAGEGSETNWHVVTVNSLMPSTVCTATKAPEPSSSALTVVHRHGPCYPRQSRSRGGAPAPAPAPAPSLTEILARDQHRVGAIRRKVAAAAAVPASSSSSSSKSKGGAGVSLQVGWARDLGSNNYFASVGLGTPATELLLELDTGSDLSWVQCEPCAGCYEQHDPLFDPAKSSTYSAVPCGARACQEFGGGSSPSRDCSSSPDEKKKKKQCDYEVYYDDDSYTNGTLARDTLTLSPTAAVPGFVFGCGHSDAGTFGEVDGLLGLGRGKASLPSQVAARYGAAAAAFSYCLPSSSSGAAGYLSFGAAAAAAPANAQFTEMVAGQDPSSYYLNLTGITVAGRAISKVSPSVFATAAGTIIDSGTAFSHLPPRAYAALRSAFRRAMGRYKYKRAPSSESDVLDTCYDFTGHETVHVPAVALVFADGATVHLHPSGVLYAWRNASVTCLTFRSNPDETTLGILGNKQQRTLAVTYDVANQKIGFAANGCA